MNDMDIRGIFAMGFIAVLFICIGLLIKKFNLAEITAGYNATKHEKYKELISKHIGNLLLYNGLFVLLSLMGNLIFKIISMSMLSHIVLGSIPLSLIVMTVYVNYKIYKLRNTNKS